MRLPDLAALNVRRLAAIVVAVGATGWMASADHSRPPRLTPTFTELGEVTMPFAPSGQQITGTWYCPGAPRRAGAGGDVVIANPNTRRLTGWVTVFTDDPAASAATVALDIDPNSMQTVDLAASQPAGTYLSAMVELTGGGGLVEQRVTNPAGNAVSACSNAAGGQWSFADGTTSAGSLEQLALTNPFPDTAIVDVTLLTTSGTRRPAALRGLPIPGRSVVSVPIDQIAQNEANVSITVAASRGRVVAARAQTYQGGGRSGFSLSLGAPSLSDQFYFADNEVKAGTINRYTVFNPNQTPIEVTVVPIGPAVDPNVSQDPIEVAPGSAQTVTLSTAADSTIKQVPPGRVGLAFSTALDTPSTFLVEQSVTRNAATSVIPGVPGSLVSQRWTMVVTPPGDLTDAVRVYNVDANDGAITVHALGPDGFVTVPSLAEVPLPARSSISLDLTGLGADLVGREMLVDCGGCRIVVTRSMPRGHQLAGRTLSVPLNG